MLCQILIEYNVEITSYLKVFVISLCKVGDIFLQTIICCFVVIIRLPRSNCFHNNCKQKKSWSLRFDPFDRVEIWTIDGTEIWSLWRSWDLMPLARLRFDPFDGVEIWSLRRGWDSQDWNNFFFCSFQNREHPKPQRREISTCEQFLWFNHGYTTESSYFYGLKRSQRKTKNIHYLVLFGLKKF